MNIPFSRRLKFAAQCIDFKGSRFAFLYPALNFKIVGIFFFRVAGPVLDECQVVCKEKSRKIHIPITKMLAKLEHCYIMNYLELTAEYIIN